MWRLCNRASCNCYIITSLMTATVIRHFQSTRVWLLLVRYNTGKNWLPHRSHQHFLIQPLKEGKRKGKKKWSNIYAIHGAKLPTVSFDPPSFLAMNSVIFTESFLQSAPNQRYRDHCLCTLAVDNCPGKIPCPLDPSHCLHVAQFCDGMPFAAISVTISIVL